MPTCFLSVLCKVCMLRIWANKYISFVILKAFWIVSTFQLGAVAIRENDYDLVSSSNLELLCYIYALGVSLSEVYTGTSQAFPLFLSHFYMLERLDQWLVGHCQFSILARVITQKVIKKVQTRARQWGGHQAFYSQNDHMWVQHVVLQYCKPVFLNALTEINKDHHRLFKISAS